MLRVYSHWAISFFVGNVSRGQIKLKLYAHKCLGYYISQNFSFLFEFW